MHVCVCFYVCRCNVHMYPYMWGSEVNFGCSSGVTHLVLGVGCLVGWFGFNFFYFLLGGDAARESVDIERLRNE